MTKRVLWLLALFALPLSIYFTLGFWVRQLADDYCVAVKPAQVGGIIGTLVYDYNNWFGRVSESLTSTLFASAGMPYIAFAAPLVLMVWYIGLAWALLETARLLRVPSPVGAALGASAVLLTAALAGSPMIVQSLYWINAIFTYAASLAVFPYVAALILASIRHQWRGWRLYSASTLAALLAFFAAAFSEPYAAVQFSALILCLAALALVRSKSAASKIGATEPTHGGSRLRYAPLIAALVGTVIAIIVILAAPGNAVRQSMFQRSPPLTAALAALEHSAAFIAASILSFSPAAALSSFAAPALLAYFLTPSVNAARSRLRIGMLSGLTAGFLLISAFMFTGFFASSQPPPSRAYIIPQSILVTSLAAAGFLSGWLVKKSRTPRRILLWIGGAAALVTIIAAPLLMAANAAALIEPLARYAEEWQIRDTLARQAADRDETTVVLPAYTFDLGARVGLESLSADPGFWINICAAAYYGVDAVIMSSES